MSDASRPNILWYCTDQQRFDTVGCLGNEYIRTPNIDRLASRGTAFTRAYTQCPICTPSRATFLTGRYPASHQVQRNGNDYFPAHLTLVTKTLADAGYDCGMAGKLHLSRAKGRVEKRPDDGYRFFRWSHHPEPDWPEGHDYDAWLREVRGIDPHEIYTMKQAYGPGVPAEFHQTTWCTEMAMEFISQEREGPWLMSLNPFDPHPPFDPPAEFLDRIDSSTLPLPLFRESDIAHQKRYRAVDQQSKDAVRIGGEPVAAQVLDEDAEDFFHSTPPSAYDPRQVKACYYAMIELIDHEFGRLVRFLEERGELENTIIIFTSDHGELLGDHGLLYKGCRFFEALVHVPLIISWPAKWSRGVVADALVELVDLPQTLLEAAGLPTRPEMQGKSLAPLLAGSADPAYHKPYVTSEYWDAIDQSDGTHGSMYFDGRYKSIVYHGHELGEIYDLEQDPGEFENLWFDSDKLELKAELLHKHLDALMGTCTAGVERTDSY
jgi:arylsulfatase